MFCADVTAKFQRPFFFVHIQITYPIYIPDTSITESLGEGPSAALPENLLLMNEEKNKRLHFIGLLTVTNALHLLQEM